MKSQLVSILEIFKNTNKKEQIEAVDSDWKTKTMVKYAS